MALRPGSCVGAYEIVTLIGSGGMGEVYRARDTKLNRDVALKVLPDAVHFDSDRLARFKREAQVLASLNHPHIGAIHGFEDSDAVQALVLELVQGPTLADRIAAGSIPLDEAVPIARQIAEALEAAHEQGIVHRDLKPANIKVTDDGHVKVLDFGLAKALEPGAGASSVTMSPTITTPAMTEVGVILGTAAYMSPEQARGRAVDKRTDIWAFGCVLFEMLTGRRAFQGEDVTDTIAAIVRGEPDWTALPASIPNQIRVLLKRCLDKDRRTRISDVSTARFLLTESIEPSIAPGTSRSATTGLPLRPVWRRALPFVATAVIAAGITAAAAWIGRRPSPPSAIVRLSFPALREGQFFTSLGRRFVTVSPDGTRLAFVADRQLYLRELSSFDARPIPGTHAETAGGVTTPVFAPDGQSLAFLWMADRSLKRIAVAGGPAITICPADPTTLGMSWDESGIIFAQGNKGVWRVSASGGQPEQIVTVGDDEYADTPQMLPGGAALLLAVAKGDARDRWERAQIVAQSLKTGQRKLLVEAGTDPRYLPTGQLLYARGGTLFASPFDITRLEITGTAVPVLEGVRRATAGFSGSQIQASPLLSGAAQFATSTNGTLVYVPGPVTLAALSQDIGFVDRAGTVERLALPKGSYGHVRMSPDGHRITFAANDASAGVSAVYVYTIGGGTAMQRLTFEGNNRFPIWTGDGKRVVYQSDREGGGIFSVPADGSGAAERLIPAEAGATLIPESWSPSGSVLLYSSTRNSRLTLWMFSIPDKTSTRFNAVESSVPIGAAFSPNGHWIAYAVDNKVFVQPFPPTGSRYLVPSGPGAHHPFWSRDGTELFYEPTIYQLEVVSVRTQPALAFGNPVSLQAGIFGSTNPAFSRNRDIDTLGKRFVTPVPAGDVAQSESITEIRVVLNWLEEVKARLAK